ncbi:MAG: hypothetical protein IPO27_12630 [Bacteroidetes bacterium]|nr:hypothetical protein [Bacteroidota bacterium]
MLRLIDSTKTTISETTDNIGGSMNNVFSVYMEGTEYKTVMKAWKRMLEDQKAKLTTDKNDVSAANAVIPSMSASPVAIFSRLLEDKGGVRLTAAVVKDGQFVSTTASQADADNVKKYLYDFAVRMKKKVVEEEVEKAAKELEKRQDDQKDLVKRKADYERDIEDYKRKISDREKDIQDNIKKQEDAKLQTDDQLKQVEALKSKLNEID